eukprot:207179-Rhodomonas_salina.3
MLRVTCACAASGAAGGARVVARRDGEPRACKVRRRHAVSGLRLSEPGLQSRANPARQSLSLCTRPGNLQFPHARTQN